MGILELSPNGERLRSTRVQSAGKRTLTVAGTSALAAIFIFAGSPAAIAAPAAAGNHISSVANDPNPDCQKSCSWPCSLRC
ncbi:MAG: hypothetical protein ACRDQU_19460 [Pseudonocardiaceae bacterium]